MPLYRAELLAKKPLRYAALIHDVSQVLYLPFDYDDGSYARDRSGHGNHGTIYGATLAAGKIGMARRFDGVDDHVEVPDDPSLRTQTNITVACWAYSLEVRDGGIITKQDGVDWSWRILTWEDDYLRATINLENAGPTHAYLLKYVKFTDGRWHYLALTYNGERIRFLVDVEEVGRTDIVDKIHITTAPINLACYWLGYGYRKIIIDEPRICNRDLSDSELRMLMYRRLI